MQSASQKRQKSFVTASSSPFAPLGVLDLSELALGQTAGSTSVVARAVVSEPPAAPIRQRKRGPAGSGVINITRLVPEQSEGEYCGLASNLELRTGVAQEANKRARHDSSVALRPRRDT
jgi:hypothetical protein